MEQLLTEAVLNLESTNVLLEGNQLLLSDIRVLLVGILIGVGACAGVVLAFLVRSVFHAS